jgi:GT2 family glycosyltransferase/glycosyltransferase involved in cell wall biosynthesis/SAM-dependent methyltransferase
MNQFNSGDKFMKMDRDMLHSCFRLKSLISPELAPLFWTPELLGKPSAWWTHVPFAFWIMSETRPRIFVELGSHHGVSYAGFCEAAVRAQTGSRCYAIDTWQGDKHADFYDDSVYRELKDFHDRRYSAFSELLRSNFDDALPRFADGSIDLLHIDGLHTYEAVKHDFESWLPKLSDRAVVLFHDTNVLRDDFGVHRLFAELALQYPHFEFLHGYGLGVLAVGASAPDGVKALCAIEDSGEIGALRERFSHLGSRWDVTTRETRGAAELNQTLEPEKQKWARIAAREAAQNAEKNLQRRASEKLDQQRETIAELNGRIEQQRQKIEELNAGIASLSGFLNSLSANFTAAFGDPGRKLKFRLKKRLMKMIGPFGKRKLERIKGADLIRRSIYFDRLWYLERNPQLVASKKDPAIHYIRYGAREGQDPGPIFSTARYLELHPEVAASGMNPLLHYLQKAETERDDLTASFMSSLPVSGDPTPAVTVHKKIAILYVSGEPNTPGNGYRVTHYVEAAKANGVEAEWIGQHELQGKLDDIVAFDVLVIWRASWNEVVERAVALMRAAGKTVVFDCDDLMTEPDLAVTKVIDGIRSQHLTEEAVKNHFSSVRETMLAADLCFTSTQELAFHMRCSGKVTHVLPNGFSQDTHDLSRRSARKWRHQRDGLIRIGYAGGSRTHQRDLGQAIEAISRILREHPECRLVLFVTPDGKWPLIDVEEFPSLHGLAHQIEWRPLQPIQDLPREMARFDINLAPLEHGNPFCEAKSELKFFEAALVNVPTVASPTGPFRRAIDHGQTGFLATTGDDWYLYLRKLVEDSALRDRLAHNAYHATLANFGPRRRALQFGCVIDQLQGGARAARGFALAAHLASKPYRAPRIFASNIVFERDKGGDAHVSVIVPLYNYEALVCETLESVFHQTLEQLDLIIVDGFSTDDSLNVALEWARSHADRFNRILVLQNQANYGLGLCRNSGFDAADTPYVLPLDADNRLLPTCCEELLEAIKASGAAYVYPTIQHFGASTDFMSNVPYDPQRFVAGNYVDAMALVAKEAWAMAGGYDHVRFGWEDYDFWCRLAEIGLAGEWYNATLAEYRVHERSMLQTHTLVSENYRNLIVNYTMRHPWVSLVDRHTCKLCSPPLVEPRLTAETAQTRLDRILPILRCPLSGEKLAYDGERIALVSLDGMQKWPIVDGRPVLSRELASPEIKAPDHISNELPEEALAIIRETSGLVLNLSGGGSREKFDHVIEVEYAIFRHTDVIADAHQLPFDDNSFDAVIVMNAFEHYREPRQVAAELRRVLKPHGRIHIRTAFLQPLHEKPWHFYNATQYGVAEWFKAFETEQLHVSSNFCPNHTLAWLASEAETALRGDVSAESADAFLSARIGSLVDVWRDPAKRTARLWTDFEKLSQDRQEITSAGFEYIGRRPRDLPDLKA